jgi:Ca2+-binding RTX toxin-like protein
VRILPFVLAALLVAVPAGAAESAPLNDAFAAAVDLGSLEAEFVEGTTVNATKEVGEPAHAGNAGGKSVWYTWTAPGDGSIPHLAVRTFASFDTLLGVYTGPAVDNLVEVASNDDGTSGGSTVSFATTPGETYRIAVDGFAGKSGAFFLTAGPSPVNDNFSEAIALTGADGTRTGDTLGGATSEPGEPPFGIESTVWYSWQPPADGTYKLSTFGTVGVDSLLGVYEGTSVESLTQLAFNDDDPDRGCCSSWVALVDAEASTTYMIQVAPLEGFGGGGQLTLSWSPLFLGTGGRDVLTGTPAVEEFRGLGGNDVILGGGGADALFGGAGNDLLNGQGGADVLFDRRGQDVLRGASGPDVLDARDRSRGDRLIGGLGADQCRRDRGDFARTCP